MTLKEARRLALEIDHAWDDGCRPRDGCTTIRAIDRRKKVRAELTRHCYNHFDEVVGALERYVYGNGPDSPDYEHLTVGEAREILARAKEVQI
jgi:hypothetical protein